MLVVEPTADGNSVDVDYEVSDARLDAWAQRHGVPSVRPHHRDLQIARLKPHSPGMGG